MSQLARSLHVPTRMCAPRLSVALLFGAGLLLAQNALAQGTAGTGASVSSGMYPPTLISIGGTTASTLAQNYLGVAQCEANDTLVFQLLSVPPTPSIDIWLGEGCNSTARTSTTTNACKFVKTVATGGVTEKFMITVPAMQLISDCMANQESMPKVWFLGVSTPQSAEEVGSNYGVYNLLTIDTLPPSAPTALKGGEGGSVISVGWKSTDTHLQGFVVFIDSSGVGAATDAGPADSGAASGSGADGGTDVDAGSARVSLGDAAVATSSSAACGPTLLVAGAAPDSLPSSVRRKKINERTASGVDLTPGDLGGAGQASIAVSAVDLAGNQGPLSNVACVRIVPTKGFFERYGADNKGSVPTGCPCSAMGPVQVENAWPIALAVLALGLSTRRRRPS